MKKIIPIILILLGVGVGIFAGVQYLYVIKCSFPQLSPAEKDKLVNISKDGLELLKNLQYEEAEKKLNEVAKSAPHELWALRNLAISLRYLGIEKKEIKYFKKAYKLCQKALDLNPTSLPTLALFGCIALELDKYGMAAVAFEDTLKYGYHLQKKECEDPYLYIWLSRAYQGIREYKKMIDMANKAREIAPLMVDPYELLKDGYTKLASVSNNKSLEIYAQKASLRLQGMDEAIKNGSNPVGFYRIQRKYGEEGPYMLAKLPYNLNENVTSAKDKKEEEVVYFVNESKRRGIEFYHGSDKTGEEIIDKYTASLFPFSGKFYVKNNPKEFIAQRIAPAFSGGVLVTDINEDGYPDIVLTNSSSNPSTQPDIVPTAFINQKDGHFVAKKIGVEIACRAMGIMGADFNHDGHIDIFMTSFEQNRLFFGDGQGNFTDASEEANINAPGWNLGAAIADFDQDGLLDIFVPGFASVPDNIDYEFTFPGSLLPAKSTLYRNQGKGTFKDIAEKAGLENAADYGVSAYPIDFDEDQDTDLLVLEWNGKLRFWENKGKDGFREVTEKVCPAQNVSGVSAAIGDVNQDGHQDIVVIGPPAGLNLYLGSGKGCFTLDPDFGETTAPLSKRCFFSGLLADIDNDGDLDIFLAENNTGKGAGGYYFLFNDGSGKFTLLQNNDSFEKIQARLSRGCASGDLDIDGDIDLVVSPIGDQCDILINRMRDNNLWQELILQRKNNKSAIGSKILLKSATHPLYYSFNPCNGYLSGGPDTIHIGLGEREIQGIFMKWPDGNIQLIQSLFPNRPYMIDETPVSSVPAPSLFTWNEKDFVYRSEIGAGVLKDSSFIQERIEIEHPSAISIAQHQPVPLYVDQIELTAVSHPAEYSLLVQEGNIIPQALTMALIKDPGVVKAWDEKGNEISKRISFEDCQYVESTSPYTMILDLGDCSKAKRILLILKGANSWPDDLSTLSSPVLRIADGKGGWADTSINVPLPLGFKRTVMVDLTDQFQTTKDYRLRLETPAHVLWDQIQVDTSDMSEGLDMVQIKLKSAVVKWLGFPQVLGWIANRFPIYDYNSVNFFSLREDPTIDNNNYGHVEGLLAKSDGDFATICPGDELLINYDLQSLPPLPKGWTRSYIFHISSSLKQQTEKSKTFFRFISGSN